MPTWLVQVTKIERDRICSLMDMLEKGGIPYESVYPLEGKIWRTDKTEFQFQAGEIYFACGSYPLSRYAHQACPHSVFSLDRYSFGDFWSIFGKENFVNDTAVICHSKDIDWSKSEELFVRPLEDTKSFNGGIYNENSLVFDGDVVVAPLKHISKEHRFFVVDGEVVTGSLYKMNGSMHESEIIDDGAKAFAKEMVAKFDYPGYVVDIATVGDEYKIMELNCLNASGFYLSNLYRLIDSIEMYYESNHPNQQTGAGADVMG